MNTRIRKHAATALTFLVICFAPLVADAQCGGACGSDCSQYSSGCNSNCGSDCKSGCSLLGGSNQCQEVRCSECYFSFFGGFTEVDDYDFVGPATFEGSFKDGWTLGAAAGRQVSANLRAEFEYTYREARGDDWIVNGNPGAWTGEFSLHTLMVNGLYDLSSMKLGPVTPYVGGGIGLGIFGSDMTTAVGTLDIDGPKFAYQGIIGGNVRLNKGADLFGEYRYLATSSVDIVNAAGNAIGSEDPVFNSFLLGIRLYR